MNREIKFKVWDKIMEDIAPLVELHSDWVAIPIMDEEGGHLEKRKIEDVELMQFTGLHDKNGKEVYEGDIVKYRTHPMKTSKGIVVWSKNEPALKILDDHIYYSLGSINMIEIIGNIYENPELLTNEN